MLVNGTITAVFREIEEITYFPLCMVRRN